MRIVLVLILFGLMQFAELAWAGDLEDLEGLEKGIQSALGVKTPVITHFHDRFEEILKANHLTSAALSESLKKCDKKFASPGKSGSTFITTSDKQFALKLISRIEFETFLRIAPRYFDHLLTQVSVLVPFYGAFEVPEKRHRYVIVMPNLVPNRSEATLCYDLKGRAKKSRARVSKVIDDNSCPTALPFDISPSTRQLILQDVAFLQKEGLMDYSLFLVRQGDSLENVSIIDYLTPYNTKKKLANFFKTFVWKANQISTIPPAAYANRMIRLADRLCGTCPKQVEEQNELVDQSEVEEELDRAVKEAVWNQFFSAYSLAGFGI